MSSNPTPIDKWEQYADEVRHCDGCGEDYNPFEESHAGHEGHEPENVYEALAEVCLRSCRNDHHDPVCRLLADAVFGNQPLSDGERYALNEVLRTEGFYAERVRARILVVFDAALAARRNGGDDW